MFGLQTFQTILKAITPRSELYMVYKKEVDNNEGWTIVLNIGLITFKSIFFRHLVANSTTNEIL